MANDSAPGSLPGRFDITTFLAGRTTAWGIFEDRFGRLRRRFRVEMDGRWDGREFVLDEAFHYDTGDRERRTWRIVPGADGRFTGSCADCLGVATGACSSDAVQMSYRFRLRMEPRSIVVTFDDRIYRMGDGLAINRATMSKWGIRLGEVSLVLVKDGAMAMPDDIGRNAA
jgi:hypothetical protein